VDGSKVSLHLKIGEVGCSDSESRLERIGSVKVDVSSLFGGEDNEGLIGHPCKWLVHIGRLFIAVFQKTPL